MLSSMFIILGPMTKKHSELLRRTLRRSSLGHSLTRIIHDGSSPPIHPSPHSMGEGWVGGRDGRAEPGGGVTSRLGVPKGVCPLRGDSTRGLAPL